MSKEKLDKHFPNIAFVNPFRRFFQPPTKIFGSYISKGQVAVDLGSGPGYFTIPMAERVGPEGKIYAVDSNVKCIRSIEKKAKKLQYDNIEAHTTSAHDLNFIENESVDFVLANGLLCSMSPKNHGLAVKEIKRILKPDGFVYISVARGSISYVDDEEWEDILKGFKVEKRSDISLSRGDHWALLSLKQE